MTNTVKPRGRLYRARRFFRRVGVHYRTLSRDPEVRTAAKHIGALGLMWLAIKKMPSADALRYRAALKWRAAAKRGTPQRKDLVMWLHGRKERPKLPWAVRTMRTKEVRRKVATRLGLSPREYTKWRGAMVGSRTIGRGRGLSPWIVGMGYKR